jgi:hypothetical protein
MSPADRNKILIAGGVAVVAILILVFVVRGRRPRGPAAGAPFAAGGEAEQVAGAETSVPSAPGEAEPAAAGGEEVAEAPAAAASVGVVTMATGPAEPTRPDPFLTFEPPPQPTPPELLVSLPPVGLVPGGLRPPGVGAGPRVGNRRVSGLLFNDQAWAVLEDEDGETFIVKPGDVVDGIRITAIARDSIFLMDRDGKKWQVPLRGLGPSSGTAGATTTVSALPPV